MILRGIMTGTKVKKELLKTTGLESKFFTTQPKRNLRSNSSSPSPTKVKVENDSKEINGSPVKKRRRVKVEVEVESASLDTPTDEINVKQEILKYEHDFTTVDKESSPNIGEFGETLKPQPKRFWEMYHEIKKMRSLIVSPVDTMGCANIPKTVSGVEIDDHTYRFQLLISLMMSSQTKDEVNYQTTKLLHETFKARGYEKGLCLEAISDVSEAELDQLIKKVGFHTRKAKYIKDTIEILKEKHNGDIPKTIEEITAFPGVGPKMGYLLLQCAWNISTGIGVDVHMFRLANMWGWVPKKSPTPEHVRIDMEKWLPKEYWSEINPVLVGFGQMICLPRGPRCDICTLAYKKMCPAVDRKLVNKAIKERQEARIKAENDTSNEVTASPQRKSRGDLSLLIKEIEDIEDLF